MIRSILYFKWFQIHNFSKIFGYVPSKSRIRIYELWVWICLLGYIIFKKTTFCFGRLCCIRVFFDYIWKQFSVIVFSFFRRHYVSCFGRRFVIHISWLILFWNFSHYFLFWKTCLIISGWFFFLSLRIILVFKRQLLVRVYREKKFVKMNLVLVNWMSIIGKSVKGLFVGADACDRVYVQLS